MRLTVLESEQRLSDQGAVSGPLGQRLVVGPQTRLVPLFEILGLDSLSDFDVGDKFSDCTVVLEQLGQLAEDGPLLEGVVDVLVGVCDVRLQRGQLVRTLIREVAHLKRASIFVHSPVVFLENFMLWTRFVFEVIVEKLVILHEFVRDALVEVMSTRFILSVHVVTLSHEFHCDTKVCWIDLAIGVSTWWLVLDIPFGKELWVVFRLWALDRTRVVLDLLLWDHSVHSMVDLMVIIKDELLQLLCLLRVKSSLLLQLLFDLFLKYFQVKFVLVRRESWLSLVVLIQHLFVFLRDLGTFLADFVDRGLMGLLSFSSTLVALVAVDSLKGPLRVFLPEEQLDV